MNLQEEILKLKERKARQFLEIEMLATVNDIAYTRFGKTCAELMKLEKQVLREVKNIFE